jgi:hypothetical protein
MYVSRSNQLLAMVLYYSPKKFVSSMTNLGKLAQKILVERRRVCNGRRDGQGLV